MNPVHLVPDVSSIVISVMIRPEWTIYKNSAFGLGCVLANNLEHSPLLTEKKKKSHILTKTTLNYVTAFVFHVDRTKPKNGLHCILTVTIVPIINLLITLHPELNMLACLECCDVT